MKIRNEKGSAYAVVLIFVSCLAVLIGSLALTSASYSKMSTNVVDSSKAFYIANAGVNEGVWWLSAKRRSPNLWNLPQAKSSPNYPFPIQRAFAGGRYTVVLSDPAEDGTVDIVATGTYRDAERTIHVTARPYGYALFSMNTLSLGRAPKTPLEAAADGDLVIVDRGLIWGLRQHLEGLRFRLDPVAGRTDAGRNVLDDYAALMQASVSTRPVDPQGYVEVLLGALHSVHWNYIRAKRRGRAWICNPDAVKTFHDLVGSFMPKKLRRARRERYDAFRQRVEDAVADLSNEQARQVLLAIVSHYPFRAHRCIWFDPRAVRPWDRFTVIDVIGRFLDTRRGRREGHAAYAGRIKDVLQRYDYSSAARSLREENDAFWKQADLLALYDQASNDKRREWLKALIAQYPFTYYARHRRSAHPPNLLDRYGAILGVRRNWGRESDAAYQKRLLAAADTGQIQIYGDIHSNQAIWTCDRADQLNQDAEIDLHGRATQVAQGDAPVAIRPVDYKAIRKLAETQQKATRQRHVWTVAEFQRLLSSRRDIRLTGVHYVYMPGDAKRAFDERRCFRFKPSRLGLIKVGGKLEVIGCLAFDLPGYPAAKSPGLYFDGRAYKALPAVRLACDVYLSPGSVRRGAVRAIGPDAEDLPVLASSGIPIQFGPSFSREGRPARALLFFLKRLERLAFTHAPAPNALDRLGATVGVQRRSDEGNREYYQRVREAVYDHFDDPGRIIAALLRQSWQDAFEPFGSREEFFDAFTVWLGHEKRRPGQLLVAFLGCLFRHLLAAPIRQHDVRLYLQGRIQCRGLVAIYSRPVIPRVFKPRRCWRKWDAYRAHGSIAAFGSIIAGGLYIERASPQTRYYFRTYGPSAGVTLCNWRVE